MSPRLQGLARRFSGVPLVAAVLNHWIYSHLAFMIELCSEFVRAHQVRYKNDAGSLLAPFPHPLVTVVVSALFLTRIDQAVEIHHLMDESSVSDILEAENLKQLAKVSRNACVFDL
jgi:hypothetical protein